MANSSTCSFKDSFKEAARKMPVVGILRDIPLGQEKACIQTALKAGLTLIEVTMNTEHAEQIITSMVEEAKGQNIMIGAGTVRTLKDFSKATSAGAQFIVSPTTIPEIIKKGKEMGIPMIPGALTPTEIETAYQAGATCVKVFPVNNVGGKDYIKSLRGPFRDIPLLACGGVNHHNAKEFLDAGSNLLAFGGSIFKPSLMKDGKWDEIEMDLRDFLITTGRT